MNQNILDVTIAPECPHKNCGQIFNESNLRLAIYLNGIFFLVKPEKGIIGFTCPRCQRTVTNSASYNDILKIKDILSNSLVEIESYSKSEDGKMLVNPKSSFDASLNYLSPFMLSAEVINELDIHYLGLNYNKDIPASIEIERYIEEEGLKDRYCSFTDDENNPISTFRTVYWFDENNIENCLNYEAEHHVRIFPRYHYRTDLVKQIHSLFGINYFMGKTFEQAKIDHAQTIESLKTVAYENNQNFEKLLEENNIHEPFVLIDIIEQNESRIANDPIIPAQFLKVLTSGPDPLGNLLTAEICNYLWAEINPFENRPFPEFFVDEIDDLDLGLKIHEKNEKHITMAKLVQENSTKQYTQQFLRENLIDFLEEYENLIQGNEFSYAHVWQLKESYLEGVYKTVNKGLREEVPYAMYHEGEGWKIVFNGKPVSGLRGIGFRWIYYIISSPKKKVYYRKLNELTQKKEKQSEETYSKDDAEAYAKANQLNLSDESVVLNKNETELEDRETSKKAYDQLIAEKKEAHSKNDSAKVDRKTREISKFLKYLDKNNIRYFLEGDELKFKASKTTETKKVTETKEATGTKYKAINDKIKKNYRDALNALKKTKDAKELLDHFSKNIRKEDGAFVYKPSEDIVWHLD